VLSGKLNRSVKLRRKERLSHRPVRPTEPGSTSRANADAGTEGLVPRKTKATKSKIENLSKKKDTNPQAEALLQANGDH